jgi:hypothetical protein
MSAEKSEMKSILTLSLANPTANTYGILETGEFIC